MATIRRLVLGLLVVAALGLAWDALPFHATADSMPAADEISTENQSTAIFAGGCFWCMEKPFDEIDGVLSTTSGYTGGDTVNPTYEEVSAGGTGHVEAVDVVYDPARVTYATLLQVFWRNIDPLDDRGQFCDKGSQYRAKIFVNGEEQQQLAEASRQALNAEPQFQDNPIVTTIEPAQTFYPAEDYHQNYYLTHPVRYKFYRTACGRDRRLAEVWGEAAGHL
ncbi:peptide-methionine (S)-S-oxide reductase MsrA [Nodosilinea nodulosa]|uniref:peptide-methionine (S)-S-oxide reductase MsrA n=1 Tax=Nodosilinea nodulosa TaxID=416001 RepID=UPI000A02409C